MLVGLGDLLANTLIHLVLQALGQNPNGAGYRPLARRGHRVA